MGYVAAAPLDALDDEAALLELEGDDPASKVSDLAILAKAAGYRGHSSSSMRPPSGSVKSSNEIPKACR